MKYSEYNFLYKSDLYRIHGRYSFSLLLKELFFGESYKYIFWMRTAKFLKSNIFFKYTLFIFARYMMGRYMYKFGIGIPYMTKIGSGFYIGHFSGIFVNSNTIIGKNCNISQGVTLGKANRGKNKGSPIIGDNVYIGPGVKIIGSIRVGNNVSIGANSVVTKDIEDNSVVVGVPAKVISNQGSVGYINRTDYELLNQKDTNE